MKRINTSGFGGIKINATLQRVWPISVYGYWLLAIGLTQNPAVLKLYTKNLTKFTSKQTRTYLRNPLKMIKKYWNEEWKNVEFDDGIAENEKFKISNYGRILNCKGEKETLVKVSFINGYQNLPLKQKQNGKSTSRYVHKLVAQHFLEQKDGIYVIHLNYDKTDNRVENLKWATKREKELHQFSNPEYKRKAGKRTYSKLTETKVKLIKRKINDPNRRTRLKMIAKQFGISEMQLYRIKTGENWSSVTEY